MAHNLLDLHAVGQYVTALSCALVKHLTDERKTKNQYRASPDPITRWLLFVQLQARKMPLRSSLSRTSGE